jgi:hypothetical protein
MAIEQGKNRKVAVVGLDAVTGTEIYSLLVSGRIEQIVLVGQRAGKLLADFNGLRSMVPLSTNAKVLIGSIEDCADAAIAVVGGAKNPNVLSLKGLQMAVKKVSEHVAALREHGFCGVILVAGSPIEVLVRAAIEASGLPDQKVLGIGNGSDLGALISEFDNECKSPSSVSLRHESSGLPDGWCTAACTNVSYVDSCNADCPFFEALTSQPGVARHYQEDALYRSPQKLAACVTQVCESVVDDLQTIAPVFVFRDGWVSRSMCVLRSGGADKRIASEKDEPSKGDQASAERLWSMLNLDGRGREPRV